MKNKIDIVLINPGDRKQVYQALGNDYSGIEPPFWIVVIAAYLRNKGFSVAIIDVNAENFSPQEAAEKVNFFKSALVCCHKYMVRNLRHRHKIWQLPERFVKNSKRGHHQRLQ
jgi:hypothetical protein